jgi:hypothetical protein
MDEFLIDIALGKETNFMNGNILSRIMTEGNDWLFTADER